ncbi:hypothetical protein VIGAN_11108600 [Vigna angularis var. angularis]|uniref:Uncharacterized protein n=1 Tax=Vigna angularis var. angularis TaxID=157739 RepID=A0A0S3T9X1_PHAAN|nr:hypothetical protein VIGAN_11108600 [Vigna angularis var. angularis]
MKPSTRDALPLAAVHLQIYQGECCCWTVEAAVPRESAGLSVSSPKFHYRAPLVILLGRLLVFSAVLDACCCL